MPPNNFSFKQHTIAILGAGYSGTLTAVNLLRESANKSVRIVLLERQFPIGRGLAYSTWDDNLLLNVPAGNMSALADDPDHFVNYCRNIDPAFGSSSFISRRIYGDYLEQTLSQAEKASVSSLQKIRGEAIAVHPQSASGSFIVELADGQSFAADQVVLAFGHSLPKNPIPQSTSLLSEAYVGNPWDFDAIGKIDPTCPVALVGAGHTAIDTLFRLTSGNNNRKVYLLSRRGLLPHVHRLAHKPPVAISPPDILKSTPYTVRALIHALRGDVKRREAIGGNWRDAINELRPYTPDIWQRLPLAERRKFLARAVAYWDIHRHRLAPSAHQRLHRMLDSGLVESVAGHMQECKRNGGEVSISVKLRNTGEIRELNVGAVINCTGPNYDIVTLTMPLIVQLRNEGLLKQDALKLGMEVDEQYQLINLQGQPVHNLFYMGPMLKAKYWEAIAIPELRIHARQLARLMLGLVIIEIPH